MAKRAKTWQYRAMAKTEVARFSCTDSRVSCLVFVHDKGTDQYEVNLGLSVPTDVSAVRGKLTRWLRANVHGTRQLLLDILPAEEGDATITLQGSMSDALDFLEFCECITPATKKQVLEDEAEDFQAFLAESDTKAQAKADAEAAATDSESDDDVASSDATSGDVNHENGGLVYSNGAL